MSEQQPASSQEFYNPNYEERRAGFVPACGASNAPFGSAIESNEAPEEGHNPESGIERGNHSGEDTPNRD